MNYSQPLTKAEYESLIARKVASQQKAREKALAKARITPPKPRKPIKRTKI